MTVLLPALAVAFAAFCVWLTVRIVNRKERWAIRVGMAVASLVVVVCVSAGAFVYWVLFHAFRGGEAAPMSPTAGARPSARSGE